MSNPKFGLPDQPEFLTRVPKAVVRALDVSQVLQRTQISLGGTATLGPLLALSSIDKYFEAARRQQHRIARTKVSILQSFGRGKGVVGLGSLFADVHFYLISWARIHKLAGFIRARTRFRRIGLVVRKYHADLTERTDARDFMEHFEERVPGGRKQSKLAVPSDLGNIANEYLTYGGRRVHIGPDSFRVLKSFRDEFSEALLYDSLEAVERQDKKQFSALLTMAASKVRITRTTKKVQRMLRGSR